jgi:hypothetical protein
MRRPGGVRSYTWGVSVAHDFEDMHRLVDRLTPEQLREVRAHALRLVSSGSRRRFVPWSELKSGASRLPPADYGRFRSDVDAVVDQDFLRDGDH